MGIVVKVAEKENLYRINKANRDKKIIEMYNSGITMAKIAEKFGISEATVSRVLKQNKKSGN